MKKKYVIPTCMELQIENEAALLTYSVEMGAADDGEWFDMGWSNEETDEPAD